jgi:hypothetical protein
MGSNPITPVWRCSSEGRAPVNVTDWRIAPQVPSEHVRGSRNAEFAVHLTKQGCELGKRVLRLRSTRGFESRHRYLQETKWEGVDLQNRLCVDSISNLESNVLQCHLRVGYSAHHRECASSTLATASKCPDSVMAAQGSPKPFVRVQILVWVLIWIESK